MNTLAEWTNLRPHLPDSVVELYDGEIRRLYDRYDDAGVRRVIQQATMLSASKDQAPRCKELEGALRDLAGAVREAVDAKKHPDLTEALFTADRLLQPLSPE